MGFRFSIVAEDIATIDSSDDDVLKDSWDVYSG